MTQSQPTNFHQFYKRKMLDANETSDSYREVTNAEKSAIEASDAQWVRPKQWVIDRFNDYCVGTLTGQKFNAGGYNEATGYFECNGILDIGIDEAKAMLEYAPLTRFVLPNHTENRWTFLQHGSATMRTLFPICFVNSGANSGSGGSMFAYWKKLEVVVFTANNFSSFDYMFSNCSRLRKVTGLCINPAANANVLYCFNQCTALEVAEIRIGRNISFSNSPLLTAESIRYICKNRIGTNEITVTLHPTTFALLTDEDNEEWFPLVELAQTKNITFVSA